MVKKNFFGVNAKNKYLKSQTLKDLEYGG